MPVLLLVRQTEAPLPRLRRICLFKNTAVFYMRSEKEHLRLCILSLPSIRRGLRAGRRHFRQPSCRVRSRG